MRSAEAMEILRALTKNRLEANFSLDDLCETIRENWPASFGEILPAAPWQLIGQKSSAPARDIHIRGLREAISEQSTSGHASATAKLTYHARWLLYLGGPECEPPPKVSIIIPIYNRGWLVDSLIKNCLKQTYAPIEIVVVDDGSTDDTPARLAKIADSIKLIRQPNAGVSAARNAGVFAATGEFLQFLDSDNLLDSACIEAKIRAFAAIADADLCYCKPTEVSLFGVKPRWRPGPAYLLSGDDVSPTIDLLDSIVADAYPFLVSAVTMPRHVFYQHGGFDTDLRRVEDARYWFRLALAGVKVIGLAHRLFYRCRMVDGLNEVRGGKDAAERLVCMRDVVDLLRRPERWPLVAEYLAGPAANKWRNLLGSEASTYGRDFDLLLETVADLPRAGRISHRSPLPLLLFLSILGERWRVSETKRRVPPTSASELLAAALVAAIQQSAPLGQRDQSDWLSREAKLRAKPMFTEVASVSALPALSSESEPRASAAMAFLRSIAGVASVGEIRADVGRMGKNKRKKNRLRATIVMPVLADPRTAERTVVSCLEQTIADRIEIVLVERQTTRTVPWSERYPRVRVIASPTADSIVEAHFAGFAAAKSKRIRFLLPGETLGSDSVERQVEASKALDDSTPIAEICRPRGLRETVRRLTVPGNRRSRPIFSAILFPRSVLFKIGAFDLPLGDEYQDRYLFRLKAAGVPFEFVEGRSSSSSEKPLTGSPAQIVVAALANLIQCFGNPQLWHHIPAVTWPVRVMDTSIVQDAELNFLKIRAVEVTLKTIGELSAPTAGRSPLVPLALCHWA